MMCWIQVSKARFSSVKMGILFIYSFPLGFLVYGTTELHDVELPVVWTAGSWKEGNISKDVRAPITAIWFFCFSFLSHNTDKKRSVPAKQKAPPTRCRLLGFPIVQFALPPSCLRRCLVINKIDSPLFSCSRNYFGGECIHMSARTCPSRTYQAGKMRDLQEILFFISSGSDGSQTTAMTIKEG